MRPRRQCYQATQPGSQDVAWPTWGFPLPCHRFVLKLKPEKVLGEPRQTADPDQLAACLFDRNRGGDEAPKTSPRLPAVIAAGMSNSPANHSSASDCILFLPSTPEACDKSIRFQANPYRFLKYRLVTHTPFGCNMFCKFDVGDGQPYRHRARGMGFCPLQKRFEHVWTRSRRARSRRLS